MTDKNLNIKIPENWYLGCNRNQNGIPLGFIVPDGTDQQADKRKATVNRWVSGVNGLNPTTIENRPLVGFRIARSLRRMGWRGANTFIRVEDPRGFELEITAQNMIMLTDACTLENGDILEECVWARDGSTNVLLPVNSAPYLEAVENTRRANSKVSLREVSIGDVIRTNKDILGEYMGSFYALYFTDGKRTGPGISQYFAPSTKKMYVIKQSNGTSTTKQTMYATSTIQVSEIVTKAATPKSMADAEVEMAQIVDADYTIPSYNWYDQTKGFVSGKFTITNVEEIKINFEDLEISAKGKTSWQQNHPTVYYRSSGGEIITFEISNFDYANRHSSNRYLSGHGVGYIKSTDFLGYTVVPSKLAMGIHYKVGNMPVIIPETTTDNFFHVRVSMQVDKTGTVITRDL